MALNSDHKTEKITISKKTIKITNTRDDIDYPRATKRDGKYVLPWKTEHQPPGSLSNLKYFFTLNDSKIPNEQKLNEEPLMHLMTPDPRRLENPPENGIRVTWLGHAGILYQFDNVNFLVNPNFNERGAKYYSPGDKNRYRKNVYNLEDLPRVDCVFITNTHLDYLDLPSVRLLNDKYGEMLLWYVPMGVEAWMHKAGVANVVELDWWKEDEVDFIDHTILSEDGEEETNTTTFNIACTPSQSYHSRDLADDNGALWCSWVVISPRYKLFLAGATGYDENVFKSIGRRFGPFHMAAIPIGGYNPAWKFAYGNTTPEEAVKIHQDILAMCSLAVAWGTFNVSNEYYLEPPQRLNDELGRTGLSEMQFFLLKHGESRLVEIKEADSEDQAVNVDANHPVSAEFDAATAGGFEGEADLYTGGGEIEINAAEASDVIADLEGDVEVHGGAIPVDGGELTICTDNSESHSETIESDATAVVSSDAGIDLEIHSHADIETNKEVNSTSLSLSLSISSSDAD